MTPEAIEAPKQFGPKYPKLEGLEKFRRASRVRELTRDEKRAYGDAVGAAIRKLQRTELMRVLTPTPSSDRPSIPRTPSPLHVKYSTPNPFPMAGDPGATLAEGRASEWDRPRLRELRLYEHAIACKRAAS